jgi:hypothetical protein
MEDRLGALFEERVGKVELEMRLQREEMERKMVRQREEMEKQRLKLEADSAQLMTINSQLLSTVTRLSTELSIVQDDLRVLHPLPYARLHLQDCIKHQIACNDAVNAFVSLHTLPVIYSNHSLTLQLQELNKAP